MAPDVVRLGTGRLVTAASRLLLALFVDPNLVFFRLTMISFTIRTAALGRGRRGVRGQRADADARSQGLFLANDSAQLVVGRRVESVLIKGSRAGEQLVKHHA